MLTSPDANMNILPLLIAALAMLLAVGLMLCAWWAMQRVENEWYVEAGLAKADTGIGTGSSSHPMGIP